MLEKIQCNNIDSEDLLENLIRSQFRLNIEEKLPIFIEEVLSFPCDAIIPIEDEGLSIFLPYLKKRSTTKRIIPSRAIYEGWDTKKRNLGKVLLVDASARTGNTIKRFHQNQISQKLKIEDSNIFIAAFFVLEEEIRKSRLKLSVDPIRYSLTEYSIAKQALAEFFYDNVIYRWGDPPLWLFTPDEEQFSQFMQRIYESKGYYTNSEDPEQNIVRITYNYFLLEDYRWLTHGVDKSEFYKVRLYIDKKNRTIKILPLFYPKISKSDNFSTYDHLQYFLPYFPKQFERLLNKSEKVENLPVYKFRWISAIGSIFLLLDFLKSLNLDNSIDYSSALSLNEPIPGLISYSCPENVLDLIEEIACLYLEENYNNPKYTPIFSNAPELNDKENNERQNIEMDLGSFLPQDLFIYQFAKIFCEREIRYKTESSDDPSHPINTGYSIEEYYKIFNSFDKTTIDRILDKLIDECFLRTRIDLVNNYYQRTYAIGGESIKRRLRVIGDKYLNLNP